LLSPEGKYALVLFSRLCLSLFLEAVASTNSIAVIDGSDTYGCALRTRVVSRGCVCLFFFLEAVASTISIAVIDGSYTYECAFELHNM
jgi:hypothetical protein